MKTASGTIKHRLRGFTYKGRGLSVLLEIDYVASAYYPAHISSIPENDHPAEGGDVEDAKFSLLEVDEDDGTKWAEEQIDQEGPQLLAAIVVWWLAEEREEIADAIAKDVMESRYDDEPDFYRD